MPEFGHDAGAWELRTREGHSWVVWLERPASGPRDSSWTARAVFRRAVVASLERLESLHIGLERWVGEDLLDDHSEPCLPRGLLGHQTASGGVAFDELEVEVLLAVQREAHHRPPGGDRGLHAALAAMDDREVDQGHQAKDRIGEGRKTAFGSRGYGSSSVSA